MSALVEVNSESRIIATTRNVEVAKKAGGIYNMQPLSGVNSKMLFHTRTCVADGVSQDRQPNEVADKILKKCDGVPLAIITIASLLVDKQRAHWSEVYDAIGFGHEDSDEVLKNTMKILSFSYYDLPSHLKACLLYLSMFPEDHFIQKKQLIWRWITEGFVPQKEGRCSYELGEICFNMLVNRSLIRWIEPDEISEDWEGGGCRVHDMVLDFICKMSHDLNFVTVHDMEQHGRVRRLALHGRSMEHKFSTAKEHVRSFYAIRCGDSRMPFLLGFKVLRVLVIEECRFFKGQTLEHLGKLVQLRYLGVVKTHVKLPEGIGHDLKFLEILDVRGGKLSELPPSVGEMQNLRCLWADKGTIMKGKIGKLTCLEELWLRSLNNCPNFFKELGNLANLRVLYIDCDECEKTECKALAESLCSLHNIQTLKIDINKRSDPYLDLHETDRFVGSLEDLAPSSRLRRFWLVGIVISRMPSWLDSLCIPQLGELCLYLEVLEARDMQTIGRFPSLVTLWIVTGEEKRISYFFGSSEFQKLETLFTNIEITLGEGALPRLKQLMYSARAGIKDSLAPWHDRCPLLWRICCAMDCTNSGRGQVKAAREILNKANRTDSNVLFLNIDLKNYRRKAARLIDALGWILHGLDRPDGEEITNQRELRRMITSLETLLRDAAEPRVGRYGEQELHGFVTKFKSLLRDDATMPKEEEVRAFSTPYYLSNAIHACN
jgi:disease resistance protein RPM1